MSKAVHYKIWLRDIGLSMLIFIFLTRNLEWTTPSGCTWRWWTRSWWTLCSTASPSSSPRRESGPRGIGPHSGTPENIAIGHVLERLCFVSFVSFGIPYYKIHFCHRGQNLCGVLKLIHAACIHRVELISDLYWILLIPLRLAVYLWFSTIPKDI
jgi:hypothetical protein